jgi:hypothetical protein
MALSDRYTKVLLQSSAANLALARKKRLRLAEVRKELSQRRVVAESPSTETTAKLPILITKDMRQQLADLGYSGADIKQMTPEVAHGIISGGVTKKKREQAAVRREKLFDALEEKVLEDLDALKKRLDIAKKRLEKAQEQVEKLDGSLVDVESQRESATDPAEQEKLRKKSEWIQAHIDRAEKAESAIRREIEALDKLVSAITKTEDGLIDELQEANDAAVITPGTEDDEIVEQLMKEKLTELEEISRLRQKLMGVQKVLDKKLEKLLRIHKDIAQMVDMGGSRYEVNTLREVAEAMQKDVDDTEKEQRAIVKEILRHEDKLRDIQTERRLQELDDALKDLPEDAQNLEQVKEKAKEEIQQEDLGKEIASKPQRYKKRADEMLAYVDQVSQLYGDFILSFLAPDIPSDPKVDQFIRTANGAILKRSQEAKKLASAYSRNPMHRSAILLVPSLYEFIASTMNGVVTPDTKEAMLREYEVRQLHQAFVEAGMVKEAIDLQQILDTTKAIGRGIGNAARWTKEKGKQIGEGLSGLVDKGMEEWDRQKFQDEGPQRNPAADLKKQQRALRQLQEIEAGLKKQLDLAQKLQDRFQREGDQDSAREARNQILRLQDQLKTVGERKDILSKGLAHKPESGLMRGQEQAAQRPKSDFEQSLRLLAQSMPKLTGFVKEGLPQDQGLERELLRHSDRIAEAARRMIQESFKAKRKYPNLPPTIQAYGHMFLAIDDALHKALRSQAEAA